MAERREDAVEASGLERKVFRIALPPLDVEASQAVGAGHLWMLWRHVWPNVKPLALTLLALKLAVDMAGEGLIDEKTAILRVDPMALDQLLHPTLDPKAPRDVLTKGLPASPGAASGKIMFDADSAEKAAAMGEAVILVRVETSPEDIHGMHAAKGILTARGGIRAELYSANGDIERNENFVSRYGFSRMLIVLHATGKASIATLG